MQLVYLSTDELNRSLVRQWSDRWGIEVACPDGGEATEEHPFDALLLDLDHTTSEWLGSLATCLEVSDRGCPVAIHGYNSSSDAFRSAYGDRGVTVCPQLADELLGALSTGFSQFPRAADSQRG
jgi:hypothetical protein